MANQNDGEMTIQLLRIMRILNDAYILSNDEDLWQGLEDPLSQYQDNCRDYRKILKQVGDITTNEDLEFIKRKHHDSRIAYVENKIDLIPITLDLNIFLSEKIEQHGTIADVDEDDFTEEDQPDPVADTDTDTDNGNG